MVAWEDSNFRVKVRETRKAKDESDQHGEKIKSGKM
jgi:hypothetical protein